LSNKKRHKNYFFFATFFLFVILKKSQSIQKATSFLSSLLKYVSLLGGVMVWVGLSFASDGLIWAFLGILRHGGAAGYTRATPLKLQNISKSRKFFQVGPKN